MTAKTSPPALNAQRSAWVKLTLLTILTCSWTGGQVRGQVLQCVGVDGCRCTLDDGSVIDVSSLGRSDGTPRFDKIQGDDTFYYSFNPCYGFTENQCVDTAVCQSDGTNYYPAGDASTATWSYDGQTAVVFYESGGDVYRQSFVSFVCDATAEEPTMTAEGEVEYATYYMQVTSKCACPGTCASSSGGGGGDGGLSGGSIVLIIFFSVLIVYLVGGLVFNRTQRQATGVEMIPNSAVWTSIPGLVKDGFVFVLGTCRGGRSGYDQV